ncbi:uncharacterized protein LOC129216315 [Uloborus diversus]|uniref:uncharacterized protein LOC129216315 n=1 Tax=Uloborus diversus TaxID=327109 RepID=UPI00240A80E8|nr:uncharacterized protein LOC129216315 [Uloborus diversus]
MINQNIQTEVQREIGQNDEIFMEKRSTCYRDMNCQFYPYFPFLSHFAQIQMSCKVKTPKALTFNDSFFGFLCIFGTTETNVGRAMTLARDTFVSTKSELDDIYKFLNLVEGIDGLYVVINSACIEVTQSCFDSIDLKNLKYNFIYVECYKTNNFIHVTYKTGLLYKKLEDNLWVTARDLHYWIKKVYNITKLSDLIKFKGYEFITSYSADIIKYSKHNAYPRNLLALNNLKNAVLATTPRFNLFFCETISAYTKLTLKHYPILIPENKLSEYFTMFLPRVNLMYYSFKGFTQEDCIAMHNKVEVFNCYRFYTVKLKFKNKATKYFRAIQGPQNPQELKSFLGCIICPSSSIEIATQTMHVSFKKINEHVIQVYFEKPHFQVIKWFISDTFLFISITRFHKCSFGDKLCNLNGQKGVICTFNTFPRSKHHVEPDLIINPYSILSRQTMGQIKETIDLGGKDYDDLSNSDGISVPGTALIGPVHYFPISYWSSEHNYIATQCVRDKILGQPVRGRSRHGGMRIGNMEYFSCFMGNGLASCFEEKTVEHTDSIIYNGILIPKSVLLCKEDAAYFKCNISFDSKPVIE